MLVIGAGGLGSPALLYLAAAGVGTLGIVEFDTVDESNLQRQIIHGQSDVGKSEGAVGPASRSPRPTRWSTSCCTTTRLDNDNVMEIFAQYDLIVDGTDNFATRYLVNDAAVLLGKPYVWGSIYRFDGQVSVFWAEHGPCYRCLYPEPPPPGHGARAAPRAACSACCARRSASTQVTEAIKLLAGIGDPLIGRLQIYDALEMSWRQLKVRKDPNCAICGENPTVTELIDYDAFCGAITEEAAEAAAGHTVGVKQLEEWLADARVRREGLPADRRPREGRARHQPDPRLGADPQGRLPDRRGARPAAAGQAGGPLLQDRRAVSRGAGHRARRRAGRRGPRRRRGQRLGQPDRPHATGVLDPASGGRSR